MRVFDFGGLQAGSLSVVGSLPTTRSRSEPQVTHLLSRRGVGQLSVERWGRHTPGRQACEQVIELILHPKFSRRRPAADLDEEVVGPK
jgi:hypothetical protein